MTSPAPLVSNNNRDDPNNYVSFDDFIAGSTPVYSLQTKAADWNACHPTDQVKAYGDSIVPPTGPNHQAFTNEDTGIDNVFAVIQLVGAGIELFVGGGAVLAPEPTGVTKVIGSIVFLHGIDTGRAALKTLISGDRTSTYTQQGASGLASWAGATPKVAETIGVVTDIGVGVGGSFGLGALSKTGPGAAQLVHLTNADSATAIRASAELGLGRSTVYAGPKAIANAKGWGMIWRTGRPASEMTETILLPTAANKSFLVVQPIGPFSAWQRINGTVFSAGTGTFNLTTGAFTRTGSGLHQIGIYSLDSAVMASVRAMPGAIDISKK